MILGFAINFATSYISYKLVFLTAFALLITVLLVKPSGIFSSSKGRKD
jgi:branched-chain amino acid transport system permease protein